MALTNTTAVLLGRGRDRQRDGPGGPRHTEGWPSKAQEKLLSAHQGEVSGAAALPTRISDLTPALQEGAVQARAEVLCPGPSTAGAAPTTPQSSARLPSPWEVPGAANQLLAPQSGQNLRLQAPALQEGPGPGKPRGTRSLVEPAGPSRSAAKRPRRSATPARPRPASHPERRPLRSPTRQEPRHAAPSWAVRA